MTLAIIISFCIFCSLPLAVAARAQAQSGQQPPSNTQSAGSPASSGQAGGGQTPVTSETQAGNHSSSATAAKKTATAHSKRVAAKKTAPCSAPANGKNSSAAGDSLPVDPSTATPTSNTAAAHPPPCAPAKVVIRDGGTTDASVQVTGSSAPAKDSAQRANIDHLLESTEESIKRTGGMQLAATQLETVQQVHQYIAQSKEALEAGDLELARNLAVKAHLLADQLLQPRP